MNEYVSHPISEWLVWTIVISTILTGIFMISFAQFTMRRMEKQFAKESRSAQIRGDFGGGRIIRYALVILLPANLSTNLNRLIDVELVRAHMSNGGELFFLEFLAVFGYYLF